MIHRYKTSSRFYPGFALINSPQDKCCAFIHPSTSPKSAPLFIKPGLIKTGSSFFNLQTLERKTVDDMVDSECSSGCESGWTLYLDQSVLSPYPLERRKTEKQSVSKDEDEEEEDLSMVSDASSGPRIFHEEEYFGNADNGFCYRDDIDPTLVKNRGKREKNRGNRRREVEEEDDPSFLDDTASSPVFNFSQNNYPLTNKETSMENLHDFSQGWSATHFETNNGVLQGRSAIFHDEPFGFFQFPLSANQLQQNQWFGGNLGMR